MMVPRRKIDESDGGCRARLQPKPPIEALHFSWSIDQVLFLLLLLSEETIHNSHTRKVIYSEINYILYKWPLVCLDFFFRLAWYTLVLWNFFFGKTISPNQFLISFTYQVMSSFHRSHSSILIAWLGTSAAGHGWNEAANWGTAF